MVHPASPFPNQQLHVEYSPAELEFLQAIDRYKRLHRRPFPTWKEVFDIFIGLGYRKAAAPAVQQPAERDAA